MSTGITGVGDVAIDDVSLSPECFGIGRTVRGKNHGQCYQCFPFVEFAGVPQEIVKDFNYYNPIIESEIKPEQHADFANETGISLELEITLPCGNGNSILRSNLTWFRCVNCMNVQ